MMSLKGFNSVSVSQPDSVLHKMSKDYIISVPPLVSMQLNEDC